MVRPGNKPPVTERELQAYTDELGILHHEERLEITLAPNALSRFSNK